MSEAPKRGVGPTALVTVGSTKFIDLISAATSDDCLEALRDRGFVRLLLQKGDGPLDQADIRPPEGLLVKIFNYDRDIERIMAESDLIISHAGSGSVLSALRGPTFDPRPSKRLIIVPNTDLMDNHQAELAQELAQRGWAKVVEPRDLGRTIRSLDLGEKIRGPPEPSPKAFSNILDSMFA